MLAKSKAPVGVLPADGAPSALVSPVSQTRDGHRRGSAPADVLDGLDDLLASATIHQTTDSPRRLPAVPDRSDNGTCPSNPGPLPTTHTPSAAATTAGWTKSAIFGELGVEDNNADGLGLSSDSQKPAQQTDMSRSTTPPTGTGKPGNVDEILDDDFSQLWDAAMLEAMVSHSTAPTDSHTATQPATEAAPAGDYVGTATNLSLLLEAYVAQRKDWRVNDDSPDSSCTVRGDDDDDDEDDSSHSDSDSVNSKSIGNISHPRSTSASAGSNPYNGAGYSSIQNTRDNSHGAGGTGTTTAYEQIAPRKRRSSGTRATFDNTNRASFYNMVRELLDVSRSRGDSFRTVSASRTRARSARSRSGTQAPQNLSNSTTSDESGYSGSCLEPSVKTNSEASEANSRQSQPRKFFPTRGEAAAAVAAAEAAAGTGEIVNTRERKLLAKKSDGNDQSTGSTSPRTSASHGKGAPQKPADPRRRHSSDGANTKAPGSRQGSVLGSLYRGMDESRPSVWGRMTTKTTSSFHGQPSSSQRKQAPHSAPQPVPLFTSTEEGVVSPNGQHVKSTIAAAAAVNAGNRATPQEPEPQRLTTHGRHNSLSSGDTRGQRGTPSSLDDDVKDFPLLPPRQGSRATSLTLTSDPPVLGRTLSGQSGGTPSGTLSLQDHGPIAFKLLSFKKQDDGPIAAAADDGARSKKKKKGKKPHRDEDQKRKEKRKKDGKKKSDKKEGAGGGGAETETANRPATAGGKDGVEGSADAKAGGPPHTASAQQSGEAAAAGHNTSNAGVSFGGGRPGDMQKQSSFFATDSVPPVPSATTPAATVQRKDSARPSDATTHTRPRTLSKGPAATPAPPRQPPRQPPRMSSLAPQQQSHLANRGVRQPPERPSHPFPVPNRPPPVLHKPPPPLVGATPRDNVPIQGAHGSVGNLKLPTYSTTATVRRVTVTHSGGSVTRRDNASSNGDRSSGDPPTAAADTAQRSPHASSPPTVDSDKAENVSRPRSEPPAGTNDDEETCDYPIAALDVDDDDNPFTITNSLSPQLVTAPNAVSRVPLGKRLPHNRGSSNTIQRRRSTHSIVKLVDSADERLPPL